MRNLLRFSFGLTLNLAQLHKLFILYIHIFTMLTNFCNEKDRFHFYLYKMETIFKHSNAFTKGDLITSSKNRFGIFIFDSSCKQTTCCIPMSWERICYMLIKYSSISFNVYDYLYMYSGLYFKRHLSLFVRNNLIPIHSNQIKSCRSRLLSSNGLKLPIYIDVKCHMTQWWIAKS